MQAAIDYLLNHPEIAAAAAEEEEEAAPPPPTLQRQQSADLRNLVAMGFTATQVSR